MAEFFRSIPRLLELAVGWVFSPSWLPPQDFEFLRWLVVPGYGYGFVLIAFGLLELVVPQERRPWGRASLLSTTYLAFAGKITLYAVIVAPLIRKAWLSLNLPSLHLDRVLPLPLYMLTGVLTVTFVAYWAHRLMHRVPAFWNIHKIHHSVTNLNWTSVYHMHFLELLLNTPASLIVTLALGTDLVAPFGIIFMTIDVLGHSNVRFNLGRLAYIISTPQAHRVHHSIDPKDYDSNFGNTFMVWDHLFGTFRYDPAHPPTAYGVTDEVPPSFVKQQALPLVWIGRGAWNSTLRLFRRPPR